MAVFHAMTAGCGGIVHRGTLGPTSCGSEPTTAGLWFAVHGRTVRLGFACDHHVFELEQRLSQGPEACRAVSGIQDRLRPDR